MLGVVEDSRLDVLLRIVLLLLEWSIVRLLAYIGDLRIYLHDWGGMGGRVGRRLC